MSSSVIQFASLNVRGLNDRAKRLLVFDFFKNSNFSIILLQETKSRFKDENDIKNCWHNKKIVINSTKSQNCSGGTMILFNTNSFVILDSVLTPDGRCIALDVECDGNRYHIINTYFPNSEGEQKTFIASLYPLISSQYPIIWGGDFNIAPNAKVDRFPSTLVNDIHSYDLNLVTSTFNLSDICRKLHPAKQFFSFRRGNSKSRIDHFYVSSQITVNNYMHQDFPTSDHDIISIKVPNSKFLFRGKGYWKNKTKLYENELFLDKFKVFWAENLRNNKYANTGSWWVETKFQIKKFMIKLNNEMVDKTQEEIKNARLLLEREKYLTTLYPNNIRVNRNYFKCKEDLAKKQIADIKERIIHDKAADLVRGDAPTKKFFEKLKRLKLDQEPLEIYKKDGTIEKNPFKLVNVAKEFFLDKFRPFNNSDSRPQEKFLNFLTPLDENDPDLNFLMQPVTLDELADAIKTFLKGKCPGIDGLSIEFYIKCFGIIKYELLEFINYVIFGGHLPRKVNVGIVKLIHKKGDKKDLQNYRPITLMNVDLKIITKIFTLRLKSILPKILHTDQYAQPGKQISDLNCLVRDILEEMENGSFDNFFVKFDFHKAFDSISHGFLFECLKKMNFPESFIAFLKKLYKNAISKVMINGFISRPFNLFRGSRQGDPLSLFIFIIVLNALLIYLNMDSRLIPFRSKSNKKFLTHAFADDLNISTGSLTTLLRILNHLEDFRKASGLKINLSKTYVFFSINAM